MSQNRASMPLVAIVGRPNVGKSTLFNRLIGRRQSIIDSEAGLTRDRLYGVTDWQGRSFAVVDTAGLDRQARGELVENTQQGTRAALEEADAIIFVVDVRDGLTALDTEVAEMLRRRHQPMVLAANKAESQKDPGYLHELFTLGLGQPSPISAIQGTGVGDLLDLVVEILPPAVEEEGDETPGDSLSVSILGRPNVGKSSLLNAILGDERSLVATVPGTTRDPVDIEIDVDDKHIRLVDTAGIRRKGVTKGGVEHYSVLRGLRALERSDVALVVIDATEGILAQDQHIAGYAIDGGKGVVLVVNKWDLLPQEERDDRVWRQKLDNAFKFIPGAPVVYASALTGRRVADVMPTTIRVDANRRRRIPTPELNRVVQKAMEDNPPPTRKGKQLRVLYATQGKERAPTIVLFVNDPDLAHFSYRRYLENQIREKYDFAGVPMRLLMRKRAEEK